MATSLSVTQLGESAARLRTASDYSAPGRSSSKAFSTVTCEKGTSFDGGNMCIERITDGKPIRIVTLLTHSRQYGQTCIGTL
jgi:hypothetical protein